MQMGSIARDVCAGAGGDQLMEPGAAANVPPALRNYFAPDTLDLAYQDAAPYLHFKLTAQPTDENLAEFLRKAKQYDLLRYIY